MDWNETQELKEYYRRYDSLSRADLVLGGLTLGFFAAILLANLGSTPDLGSIVVRSAVALALAAGAVACFAGALRWGRQAKHVDAPSETGRPAAFTKSEEMDISNARSKAA